MIYLTTAAMNSCNIALI